jgi:hypothetical protein
MNAQDLALAMQDLDEAIGEEYQRHKLAMQALRDHMADLRQQYDAAYADEFGTGGTGSSPGYSEACGVWN